MSKPGVATAMMHSSARMLLAAAVGLVCAAAVLIGLDPGAPRVASARPLASVLIVNNTLDDGSSGTLRSVLASANAGDTIQFSLTASSIITLTGGQLTVAKAITIDGSTAVNLAVSGNNASRVLMATAPVNIISLTVMNGKVTGQGGGINAVGSLTLTNVSLISNTASSNGGGAAVAGAATLSGGVFQNNHSTGGNGGALDAAGTLAMTGTQFISNTAGQQGGGLYANVNALLTNATFISNTALAKEGGGANIQGVATVSGGTFALNSALNSTLGIGGGLFVHNTLVLTGTQFLSNTAGMNAGGLLATSATTLSNATFISNTALAGIGGGARINGPATLSGGTFMLNSAPYTTTNGNGGGLVAQSVLTLTGTSFLTNTAGNSGGGAYVYAATLDGGAFQNNISMNGEGGGLYVSSTLALTGTQFLSNTAYSGGGATVDGMATLSGGLFQNNRAYNGAGLFAYDTLALTGTNFVSNTADGLGGGLFANSALALTGTNFLSNTANSGGGAFADYTATLSGGVFQNNGANYFGGGLDAYGPLALTGTQFLSNTTYNSGGDGGGAFVNYMATLSGGLFQNNESRGGNGGGLRADGTLALSGTQFLSNTAHSNGGGAYAYGTATLSGGLFQYNSCTTSGCLGGGLVAFDTFVLTGTQFIANTADSGGGVYLNGSFGGDGGVVNALFARNSAGSGAAMLLATSGTVQILFTTVASPIVASGSAVSATGGVLFIYDTIVTGYTTPLETSGTVISGSNDLAGGNLGFVDPAHDNYHLTPGSDAIGAGVDKGVYTDLDGGLRPVGGRFDVGAYEFPGVVSRLFLPLIRR